ncbi:MAG TPA: hypothetical protein VFK78_03425 [Gemmatimonadales bacterium]|nr:hypothetical protein [Gemmatimonadales bacterium]
MSACAPGTTRPAFLPYPEALTAIVNAPPARAIAEATGFFAGEGVQVSFVNPADGFLETTWYDTRTHRSAPGNAESADLSSTVKIRCWADPDVPGKARFTVEPVYRPALDPSRPERDLEVMVPIGSDGYRIAQRLLAELAQKFGGQ